MISIIIPTLNEESVIEGTLKGLRTNFSLPHEVIVSDGRSKDRTVEIARSWSNKVVEHLTPERQTIAAGRNAGAKEALGEFLAFIDADCTILNPDAFFNQIIKHFERDPKLVAVNVAIRVLPEYENWADWLIYNLFNDYLWLVNNVLKFGMSAGEFQMMRKDVFEKIGGYNEKLVASEDIDLFGRLSKVGHVRYEKGLTIYHTGRRAHKIGWPKLLTQWIVNSLSMWIRGRAHSKEWKPIR